ncbi:MAG: diacylglycerol kinase family protein [Bacilli bacterium]|nr:diacylglycerol kinase family protein [Bacilli bacterium]
MIYILYNPLANNSRGQIDAEHWAERLTTKPTFKSVIGLNFKDFFKKVKASDEVILCGGDGTLNRFANDTYGTKFNCKLSYAKCGSGNDFYRDVADQEVDGRIDLKPYLKHLPLIKVNGIKRRFLNGIGYGIDGDTCLAGDEIRTKDPNAVINYTKIAVGLLLGKFKTKTAEVEVDGVKSTFKHVWLSSTMNGKYYGGGMMAAPKQDRLNAKHECDLVTLSSIGRVHTLLRFPKFSGGKHDKKRFLTHLRGKHIKVTFSSPCALQIDGDVIKDVTTYEVISE